MINDLGKFQEETVIANSDSKAKRNVKLTNPNFKVLEDKWFINSFN